MQNTASKWVLILAGSFAGLAILGCNDFRLSASTQRRAITRPTSKLDAAQRSKEFRKPLSASRLSFYRRNTVVTAFEIASTHRTKS